MNITTVLEGDLIDFERSPFVKHSRFQDGFFKSIENSEKWLGLSIRYDEWLESKGSLSSHVPKKIHQIWVGSPLPKKFEVLTQTWKEKHPSWEYTLWDETRILALTPFPAKKAFIKAKSNGVKSDIARYEILRQFGGVYADTDFECIASFDDLVSRCTFFAGTIFGTNPGFANGLIGCTAGHPIMQQLCDRTMKPILTTEIMDVINTTGPGLLTEIYFAMEKRLEKTDIMLPSQYFYPLPNFADEKSLTKAEKHAFCSAESLAIHHWAVSWSKVSFFQYLIRKFNRGIKKLRKIFC